MRDLERTRPDVGRWLLEWSGRMGRGPAGSGGLACGHLAAPGPERDAGGCLRPSRPADPRGSAPAATPTIAGASPTLTTPRAIVPLLSPRRDEGHLVLLLDYDGTLVPFADAPPLATPDPELLALLAALAARPLTQVHVVSGRAPDTLDAWLGALPIGLHAEHGRWSRLAGAPVWTGRPVPDAWWRPAALALIEECAARTPGSLVEAKPSGLAWHYREVAPHLREPRAHDLARRLAALLGTAPAELVWGAMILEIRPRGIHKGLIIAPIAAGAPPGSRLVAIGDDLTDEDLFEALPPDGISLHVGPGPSRATFRVNDVHDVRRILAALLDPGGLPGGTRA